MSWNKSITSSWRTKHFFVVILPLFYLSCMLSHNSHVLLYLNGLNPCIKHLDVFWIMWGLMLWREAGNERSSFSGYYKYGAFVIVKSEQELKIKSHFGIFDPVIGEGQLYYDTASLDLRCICKLFGNIVFLYTMKSILHLCKSLADTGLIYTLSSFSNFDHLHLLRSD